MTKALFMITNNQYLAIGGIAVNLHGFGRSTGDLDIMLDMHRDNLLKFLNLMMELSFELRQPVNSMDILKPEIRHQWQNEKNMIALTWVHRTRVFEVVDVVFHMEDQFEPLRANAKMCELDGYQIPIIAIDDLITLKEQTKRERDRQDVEALKKIRGMNGGT
jgi:hypothetical protein